VAALTRTLGVPNCQAAVGGLTWHAAENVLTTEGDDMGGLAPD
jgi:hypothetical protein